MSSSAVTYLSLEVTELTSLARWAVQRAPGSASSSPLHARFTESHCHPLLSRWILGDPNSGLLVTEPPLDHKHPFS